MEEKKGIAEDIAAADVRHAHEGKPMTELERIRHSCAHVFATAILKIWPEAQFPAGLSVRE
jgi:threonyl-tRNA synthetase